MSDTTYRLGDDLTDSIESLAGSVDQEHSVAGSADQKQKHSAGDSTDQEPVFAMSSDDYDPLVDLGTGRKFSQPWSAMKFESLKDNPILSSMKAQDGSRIHNDFANQALMITYTAMRGQPATWVQKKPKGMLETLLGPKEEDRRRSSESSSEGNRSDDLTPEVRVTPSQFLKLAEGAQRWDAHHAKDPDNVLATATRMRPEGPSDPNRDHYPYYLADRVRQYDEVTGEEISPLYAVPTQPSLIYTPPGVDEHVVVRQNFRDKYVRMAPEVAQEVQEYLAAANGTAQPASTSERYSVNETRQVADKDQPDPNLGSPDGTHYAEFLAARYEEIAKQEAINKATSWEIEKQRYTVAFLEDHHAKVVINSGLAQELRVREQRKHQADLEQSVLENIEKEQRDERVRDHMRSHIRDVQERLYHTRVIGDDIQRQLKSNANHIQYLQNAIDEQCLLLGHEVPDDVFKEVEERLEVEKERAYAELGRPMDKGKGKEKETQQRKPGANFYNTAAKYPSPEQTYPRFDQDVQHTNNAPGPSQPLRHRSRLDVPTLSEWEHEHGL